MNWTDDGWKAFVREYLDNEEMTVSPRTLNLLKEAWLHGARGAIDEATKALKPIPEKPQ